MPEFLSRDPREPGFWDERFAQAFTPWDRGGVPLELRRFAAAGRPGTILIPGCGSGYELAWLMEQGWDASAIDFAPLAVERAQRIAGRWAGRVVQADFFAWEPEKALDVVYECAFFCALPPAMRDQVVARWAGLLGPGKLLAGFFYFGERSKGPPFGIPREELERLLAPHFDLVEDSAVEDSLAVFEGRERWMVWRRK
ncbi:SAM-dependent methyltransferase [Massilia sp. KIM]|uniref:methyltransferase n=1 Tax=Massilia sp. KIM TaxID=1955422 RepID=UPI00098FFC95|nr:methyltransferase [Massilia sp. KIM]OON59770.1 SAM-dependent methyltransferase [Massilia sp. KIM]